MLKRAQRQPIVYDPEQGQQDLGCEGLDSHIPDAAATLALLAGPFAEAVTKLAPQILAVSALPQLLQLLSDDSFMERSIENICRQLRQRYSYSGIDKSPHFVAGAGCVC